MTVSATSLFLTRRRCSAQPAERANQLDVAIAEDFHVILGEGECGQKLVSRGAGKQIVVQDDSQAAFASLNADLVAEAAVGVTADFARAQELNEAILQGATDIIAELPRILVPALAGARADHEIALGYQAPAIEAFQDRKLGILPEDMPVSVSKQNRPAAGCADSQ